MTTEIILTINARTDKTFENRASLRSCFISTSFSFKEKNMVIDKSFSFRSKKIPSGIIRGKWR